MTKPTARAALLLPLLLVGAIAIPISPAELEGQADGLGASVRSAFQRVNPRADRVTIMEVRLLVDHRNDAADLRYVLLAHAIRQDQVFPGSFDDELFGIFEIDGDLASVVRTIGSFRSPRWNDYAVWIESVNRTDIVLGGAGATYRDDPRRWVFELGPQ